MTAVIAVVIIVLNLGHLGHIYVVSVPPALFSCALFIPYIPLIDDCHTYLNHLHTDHVPSDMYPMYDEKM
jgi:hypothetical protein